MCPYSMAGILLLFIDTSYNYMFCAVIKSMNEYLSELKKYLIPYL